MISQLIGDQIGAGQCIQSLLADPKYTNMKLMAAFVKNAGVGRILGDLKNFRNRGGSIEGIVGIDHQGSTMQGLQQLSNISDNNIHIHYEKNSCTFHPKVYMFEGKTDLAILIGSTNLTCGGLFTNHEANVLLKPELSQSDKQFISEINLYYRSMLKDTNTKLADKKLLDELFKQGLIEDETKNRNFSKIINQVSRIPFGTGKSKKAPPPQATLPISTAKKVIFVMTLSAFDVSQKSLDPVILIPIKALRENSSFWDWPLAFTFSASGYPERYTNVDINISGISLKRMNVRIYYYDRKSEFRLQCEPVKRNGRPGDIVLIEKNHNIGVEYTISLVSKSKAEHKKYLLMCKNKVSDQKYYGFYET